MKIRLALIAALALGGCTAPPASTPDRSDAPRPTATTPPSATALRLTAVGNNPLVSPDGRLIAAISPGNSLRLLRLDETLVTTGPMFSGRAEWLPDSSGLFIETSAPQRAGPLAVVELDGRLTKQELQMADPTLSRDGRWIVAAQQEGCCAMITIREIRVAPRDGGPARTLVRSISPEDAIQAMTLYGVDDRDRVLYRDGRLLKLVSIAGGNTVDVAVRDDLDLHSLVSDGVSPDGRAFLLHTIRQSQGSAPEIDRHWLVVDGQFRPWPSQGLAPVLSRAPTRRLQAAWISDHALLARARDGSFVAMDIVSGSTTAGPDVPTEARVLAANSQTIVWVTGRNVRTTEIASARTRDTGVPIGREDEVVFAAFSVAGVVVTSAAGSYLVR